MAVGTEKNLQYEDILKRLPERPPLLMLDRMTIAEDGTHARGLKTVSFNEGYFQGHFPGSPIMPGVLQVAAMTQLCNALHRKRHGEPDSGKMLLLTGIRQLKFRQPVHPGAALQIDAEPAEDDPWTYKAWTSVDGTITCQGTLVLKEHSAEERQRTEGPLIEPLPVEPDVTGGQTLEVTDIMEAIPHRFPFLLVDRILHLDSENLRIVALKNITANEPVFAGSAVHVLPPHLQCEIAAQTGCTLALTREGHNDKLAYFMSIGRADFFAPVVPGDRLVVDLTVSAKGRFGRAEGHLAVGDKSVSEIEMKFATVDRE